MLIKSVKFIWKIIVKLLKFFLIYPYSMYKFSKTFDLDELEDDINLLNK